MPTDSSLATRDATILLKRIKGSFPDLDWDRFTFIDVGWDHEVIQLDDKYIFRFPNSPEYQSVLRDEIRLLSYLSDRIAAPIPNYSYVPQDFSFGGYPMLQGESVSPESFNTMSGDAQDMLASEVAIFLSDLHSVNVEDLAEFNVGFETHFAGYADVNIEAEKYLKPNLSAVEYKPIADMLIGIEQAKQQAQPSRLIHGDIAPKHIIWDAGTKRVGLIDFSDRSISDPAYDFAELYTYGEPFVDKVYALYESPDKNEQFLVRAKAYMKAIGVHSLANTYCTDKVQLDEAMRLLKIGMALS